jgi:ABC-type spermidine/putrescine transport system permease subunit II
MGPRLRGLLAATVAGACVLPFLTLALLSVAGAWEFPDLLPASFRFDRWTSVVGGDRALASSLGVSLLVSTAVGLIATAAGFVTARAVAGHPRRRLLLLAAYLPFAASPVILGVCLLYVYIRLGLVATVAGVVLSHTIFAYAFAVLFWVPFWNAEKRAYEDLVRTLGGTQTDALRRVLLPLSKGPMLLCFFQTFLISWFQYGLTLLVGSGKVDTLPLRVYAYVGEANLGYAAVASGLLLLPPLALSWLNRRVVHGLA